MGRSLTPIVVALGFATVGWSSCAHPVRPTLVSWRSDPVARLFCSNVAPLPSSFVPSTALHPDCEETAVGPVMQYFYTRIDNTCVAVRLSALSHHNQGLPTAALEISPDVTSASAASIGAWGCVRPSAIVFAGMDASNELPFYVTFQSGFRDGQQLVLATSVCTIRGQSHRFVRDWFHDYATCSRSEFGRSR